MKRWLLVLTLFGLMSGLTPAHTGAAPPLPTPAAATPPPDVASYRIDAAYDPAAHTITAHQTATYHNRTDEPIPDLVFHLYLNAFRSRDTVWMSEGGVGHRGFAFDPEHPGSLRIEELRRADGAMLSPEPVDPDATLVRAALPDPVAPGGAVTVEMTFTAQLPKVFARTGWADDGDFVMAGQWFPKFGVWEAGAWDAHPFHANNEFYADFGRYDVALTLPRGWVVGSTGLAQGEPEDNGDGTATHRFVAEHVIDFAWGASPHLREMTRTVDDVTVRLLHYPRQRPRARRVMRATTGALPLYSEWFGPYGLGLYDQLTVLLVPPGAGGAGGMEYPTLFTVGALGGTTPPCVRLLEVETVHELGHQWFQSVVATNEAVEPWLDEGFTDYSAVRAMHALYDGALMDCGGWSFSYLAMRRLEYTSRPETTMAGEAWEFSGFQYAIATYSKPALALTTLERTVGEEAMLRFLRTYVERYGFAHPTGEDVRAVMAETLGDAATWFFEDFAHGDGVLDAQVDALDGTVTLVREGEACVPTTVRIEQRGDAPLEIPWPCDAGPLSREVERVRSVEIDPTQDVVLDLNQANDGRRPNADKAAWLGLVIRWLRMLQALFRGGALW
jgi:hypothetical protein